ncbi:MAG: metalloregulator ArsR/SmtB family transcription factor [Hyphomicrobiales bacterium]
MTYATNTATLPPSQVFAALADDTRRDIFESLRTGPKTVTTIAHGRPISRPAVSQHLKVLADAGLVTATPQGTSRLYAVEPQGLTPLREYLDSVWGDVLSAFAAEVERQVQNQIAPSKKETET